MNRGNGGIFGKKNSTSVVGGVYSAYEQQEKSASVYWPSGQDANFAYTPLLLKTSTQASPKTTVTDSSVNNFIVSKNGTQSAGWTSPYQTDGYWGNYFNGSTDYLSTTSITAAGTGSVTYECWFYKTTLANSTVLNSRSGNTSDGIDMIVNSSGKIVITYASLGLYTGGNFTIATNTWYHLAVVRNGASSWTVYINGQVDGTFSNSVNITSTTFVIGLTLTGTSYFAGYISNVRVTNTAVYTSNFTPSTLPLSSITGTVLLTCQNNRFKDNGPSNLTLTVNGTPQATPYWYPSTFSAPAASIGAGYNGVKSDYYSIPNTAAITTLTGDFTIETWVYPTDTSATATSFAFIETRTSGATAAPWIWGMNTYTSAGWVTGFFNGTSYNFTSRVLPYVWTHVVLQRNGSTLRTFINGVVDATTNTLAGTITGGSSTIYIANSKDYGLSGYGALGYFSDFRIVNGTAVYNVAGFTPPTSQLTAVANTTLLLSFSDSNATTTTNGANNNVFIDSSPYSLTMTRNGTPTQGSFTPYLPNGNWSNYLDGSSFINFGINSYLTTGPCTVEAWVNFSSFSTGPMVVENANWNIGQNCGWRFSVGTDGKISFNASAGVFNTYPNVLTTTSAITINTWNHIAFVRDSSNVCRIYINGVDGGGSVTYSASFNLNSGVSYRGTEIGRSIADGGTYGQITGYISNLRIVNNTALYTSAFAPPDDLTAVSGTSLLTCQSNRFVDNSVNNSVVTLAGTPKVQNFKPLPSRTYSPSLYGGSGYFNGSTDSVYTSQTFALPTSTTPFTMEAWVNFSSFSGVAIASTAYAGSGSIPFVMGMASSTSFTSATATPIFTYFNGSAWTVAVQSSTSLALNTWYHLAYVYTGSTATIYANGVSIGSASVSSWQTTSQAGFYIGRRWDTSSVVYFNGYISNFRLVIGTAVYTGAFTPPTLAPITFDGQTSAASYANTANVNTSFGRTQTVLLTNFNNTAIYDASTQNDVVTIGSAQASNTFSKFPLTTSMKFNGSTDYLYINSPAGSQLDLSVGQQNWTIECWIYTLGTGGIVFGRAGTNGSVNPQYWLSIAADGSGQALINSLTYNFAAGSFRSNTWTHYVIVRKSTQIRAWINGIAQTVQTSPTMNSPGSQTFYMGARLDPSAASYFAGYVQDFRITTGIARYDPASSSAISVPTLPVGTSGRSLF